MQDQIKKLRRTIGVYQLLLLAAGATIGCLVNLVLMLMDKVKVLS